jgi:hypothetical protein
MEYKILETFGHQAQQKMEEKVQALLETGWIPIGAAIPTERQTILHLTQTLVKHKKTAKKPS